MKCFQVLSILLTARTKLKVVSVSKTCDENESFQKKNQKKKHIGRLFQSNLMQFQISTRVEQPLSCLLYTMRSVAQRQCLL